MLINRRTFTVKVGRSDELIEILHHGADHVDARPTFRVLRSQIGTFDQVELELEFDSLAEYESFWTAWSEAPQSEEVLKRFQDAVLSGGSNTVWEIV